MRDFISLRYGVPFFFVALSLLGCSSGSSPTSIPQRAVTSVPAVPAFSASSTGVASAVAGVVTISFPPSSGFGGDLSLPVSTVPANDTFAAVLSSSPPDGSSALSARRIQSVSTLTPIDYPCIAFSGGLTTIGPSTFLFTIPTRFTSLPGTYYLAQLTASGWNDAYAGPGIVAPGQVTFTVADALTFASGTPECFGLFYLAAGAPAPTASATPAVTASPSASPVGSPSPVASTAPGASPSPSPSASPSTAPSASPSPSPSPSPGVLGATPAQLNILGTGSASAQTITVAEAGYAGPFSESDTCTSAGYATVAATGTSQGPSATFSVTGESAGECTVTFSDRFTQTTSVFVNVTTSGYVIESHRR